MTPARAVAAALLAAFLASPAAAGSDERVARLVAASVAAGARAGGDPVAVVPVEIPEAQRAQYECIVERLTEARGRQATEQLIAMVETWATGTPDAAGEASVAFVNAHGEAYYGVVTECIEPGATQ